MATTPLNFRLTNRSATTLDVAWDDQDAGAFGFSLFYQLASADPDTDGWTPAVDETSPGAETFQYFGLEPNTSYRLSVMSMEAGVPSDPAIIVESTAETEVILSEWSEAVSATTFSGVTGGQRQVVYHIDRATAVAWRGGTLAFVKGFSVVLSSIRPGDRVEALPTDSNGNGDVVLAADETYTVFMPDGTSRVVTIPAGTTAFDLTDALQPVGAGA